MPLTIQLNRAIHAPPNPQFDECRREARDLMSGYFFT
jgi:hypothetical protein